MKPVFIRLPVGCDNTSPRGDVYPQERRESFAGGY